MKIQKAKCWENSMQKSPLCGTQLLLWYSCQMILPAGWCPTGTCISKPDLGSWSSRYSGGPNILSEWPCKKSFQFSLRSAQWSFLEKSSCGIVRALLVAASDSLGGFLYETRPRSRGQNYFPPRARTQHLMGWDAFSCLQINIINMKQQIYFYFWKEKTDIQGHLWRMW